MRAVESTRRRRLRVRGPLRRVDPVERDRSAPLDELAEIELDARAVDDVQARDGAFRDEQAQRVGPDVDDRYSHARHPRVCSGWIEITGKGPSGFAVHG